MEFLNLYYCSFCRKSRDETKYVVAGPDGINICDVCVDQCAEILAAAREKHNKALNSERAKSGSVREIKNN